MPKNLFSERSFIMQFTQRNKIMVIILTITCTTRYSFINEEFIETVCQILKIEPQCLIKPKQIQRFDGRVAKPITHAIYPSLTFDTHTKSLVSLLLTKLENHPIILCQP